MTVKAILAFLRKLPFVGSIIAWFAKKKRLFVEYTLLALFVCFSGLALSLWLTKKELKSELMQTEEKLEGVKSRLTTVEFSNSVLEQTAESLRELRERDHNTLRSLIGEFEDLSTRNSTVRTRLQELEKSNEVVLELRNQPVPAELGCLLEPRSCQAGDPARSGN